MHEVKDDRKIQEDVVALFFDNFRNIQLVLKGVRHIATETTSCELASQKDAHTFKMEKKTINTKPNIYGNNFMPLE